MDDSPRQPDEFPGAAASLDVPAQLRYSADHIWVEDVDGLLTIGITEYAANQMGELVYVDLPEPSDEVRAGDEVVELESAKAVQSLVCPVDGTVLYVNGDVADDPAIVNNDPYGEGWILKIEPSDDEPELMDAARYAQMVKSVN
ncbi:glycine cleavage system H protein [Bifidobacterium bohemicum]|uniref:Glycine cleavage system H protein n=1 Tax=Bifidobacterium bohemicum DSM 22767 TaxID=1437606 RepID=A0A086ZGZ4_9BIFI|nr:glycine cleavage system protein GcvH [Bifidobacterium bohemicum]KFI45794.1 glycine cleavage system H protein [Bifidobacterium bohemicum DSM 22767]SCC10828.1 glycine cleavage system H protein [Bifidobacterium bohemicum]